MAWTMSYCTLDRSTMFGLPETLEEQFRAAAAAGFEMVTPDIFSLRVYHDTHGSLAGLRAVADECGLAVYDLSGVTITDEAETTRRDVAEFIDFAQQLGAEWVQSRLPVDNAASRRLYFEAARAVADAGFGFAFEYSPFVPLDNLRDAVAFIGEVAADAPRQCVIIDTWHFFRSGDTFEDLLSVDPAMIGYFQLDDALPLGDDLRFDTLNRREIPGLGQLDLVGFLRACQSHGLGDLVVSVEVMSETRRSGPLGDYMKDIYDGTRAVLSAAGSAP